MSQTAPATAAIDLPVMRPLLPRRAALVPYLDSIDANRWYSNYGPLARELESRLAGVLEVPEGGVLSAGNATAALAAALIALELPPGSLVAVPAWTFCATAHAVVQAGLTPCFLDVDKDTWALSAETVRVALAAGRPVAAAVPVVPFGAPMDAEPWRRLRAETGVPVVVDAAAAFDTWRGGAVPAVVSLHATKVLGAGEGGVLIADDADLIARARRACTFGFDGLAEATGPGFNGKMSEYIAAVALAALDAWPEARRDWRAAAALYAPLAGRADVPGQPGFGTRWVGSVYVVRLPGRDGRAVGDALARQGVGSRPWWPLALPDHPAFAACPTDEAAVARRLAGESLGLPFFRDLTPAQAGRAMAALDSALTTSSA